MPSTSALVPSTSALVPSTSSRQQDALRARSPHRGSLAQNRVARAAYRWKASARTRRWCPVRVARARYRGTHAAYRLKTSARTRRSCRATIGRAEVTRRHPPAPRLSRPVARSSCPVPPDACRVHPSRTTAFSVLLWNVAFGLEAQRRDFVPPSGVSRQASNASNIIDHCAASAAPRIRTEMDVRSSLSVTPPTVKIWFCFPAA